MPIGRAKRRRINISTSEGGAGPKRAIVIYDTLYGNTEKVAKALARGLERHAQVVCANAKDADVSKLQEYDLIAIGAPTQAFSASKPMKQFLQKLEGTRLSGRYGFAFETKVDIVISGSAAKYIEKELQRAGLSIIKPRQSAIVGGGTKQAFLLEGEEKKFEEIGSEIGDALAKK